MPSDSQRSSATLLTHAAQLLTLRYPSGDTGPRRGAQTRELGLIEDGALLIADGKIVTVGTTGEVAKHEFLTAAPAHIEEIDCSGKVVLPGFVDSHTHPVFTAPRLMDFEKRISGASYEAIAEAGGGIRASLRGVRDARTEELAEHIVSGLGEMAAYGTTTVECKSGYGLNFAAEMKSLEAIREASHQCPGYVAATLMAAHVVPPEHRENPEEYVRIICADMIPTAAKLKLASFVDVFVERGAFTMEQSQRILRSAVEHNLGVRAHVCQLTPAKLAPLLQFHPASLDHMDFVSDEDAALLARLDTIATLLPAANYFLGLDKFPPARKLIDVGVAVALATDYNPGTSPTTSMPFVLSAACTHMKMSPAEAIVAATYNGACALRLQGRKGSIEPGKDADIAIFEAEDYRELAYWFGVNRCRQTLLNGIAYSQGANGH
ncbi:MAG: imidazolonepropionase [Acidobacteriota bacterium]|nr:imidazolonepropionase [Acidobacteriota bacterium]